MKILHILKTEPDMVTKTLLSAFRNPEGDEETQFRIYDKDVDYNRLIDLIFENERVISWW